VAALLLATGCSATVSTATAPVTTSTARDTPTPTAPSLSTSVMPTVPAPPTSTAVVVLDPGHNGGNASHPEESNRAVPAGGFTKPCNTTGATTDGGYPEHAFSFDVASRAAALLRREGVTVVLTRPDDGGIGPCVDARAAVANDAGADLAVSIHADGAAADAQGFHVITPAVAPDGGNASIIDPSAQAALDLRAAFGAATGQAQATYPGALVEPGLTRRNDLAGLNLARVPAVVIECANMRNAADAAAVSDASWRQRASQGITDGVLAFLGSP
jgi:N-acetylmuramoyl-L-alanine amidase